MNFRNFSIALKSLVSLSCNEGDYIYAEVPSVINYQYWSQYSDATDAELSRIDKDYKVDLEINRVELLEFGNPEDLTFTPEGDLYMSNEAENTPAYILRVLLTRNPQRI
ncbi:hypothetical protein SAMN06296241_2496 [Salinimicrobium sediminis]|uniref:Uncharacterized protein n=1 Tax=Salinimicrobium sediminis TaxID=1343891 RepID=A0A285X6I5_9FLAO|nr:hypothetical protein [Salinimicrobium sediminis]SOC80932.1 hypothetical protein SAMN06296241_2496 [Salinimicrobium sediminis]